MGDRLWRDDLANFTALALDRRAAHGHCPLCGWRGVFLRHAGRGRQICLVCGSRARHRALAVAVEGHDLWSDEPSDGAGRGLHAAPEPCLRGLLDARCGRWLRGDLRARPGDGHAVGFNLCRLPFADDTFDRLVANHVLEHIVDDEAALREMYRVLRPGGLAILMVPVVAARTEDYGFVAPARNEHARDCGPDYVERYRAVGFEVEVVTSDRLPDADAMALLSYDRGHPTVHHVPFCRKPHRRSSDRRIGR